MAVAVTQSRFRFRTDTLTVDSASVVWAAAENTNWVPTPVQRGTNFRLRFEVYNTGSTSTGAQAWNIYCQKNGAGGYTAVTTVRADGIQSADASTDADNTSLTTARLTNDAPGTPAFVNGQYDETGATGNITLGIGSTTAQKTELEFGLVITSSANLGDFFDFRVYRGAGTALSTYTVTPRVTITQAAFTASNLASGAAGLGVPALQVNPVASSLVIYTKPSSSAPPAFSLAGISFSATNLATGSDALGTPAFNQGDVFTATSLAVQADVLGTPAFAQTQILSAQGISSSAAFLGSPSFVGISGLQVTSLATGADAISVPVFGQQQALVASALVTGALTYTRPVFVGISGLTVVSLSVSADTLGTPAFTQKQVLSALSVASAATGLGTPTVALEGELVSVNIATSAALGTPTFTQNHTLNASGIASTAAVLSVPAEQVTSHLSTTDFAFSVAIDNPTIAQNQNLTAYSITTAADAFDKPQGEVVTILAASTLAAGAPALDPPTLVSMPSLLAVDVATSLAALVSPALVLSSISLGQWDLFVGGASIGQPTFTQIHTPVAPIFFDVRLPEPPRRIDVIELIPVPRDITLVTRPIPIYIFGTLTIEVDIPETTLFVDIPIKEPPRRVDVRPSMPV